MRADTLECSLITLIVAVHYNAENKCQKAAFEKMQHLWTLDHVMMM
jgi:hypothetical protein